MAAYAKDAMTTPNPWEMWESSKGQDSWSALTTHPQWYWDNNYRRKTKMITINGFRVPEPMRTTPKVHQKYYVVTLLDPNRVRSFWWDGTISEREWLEYGLFHSTKEAAYEHASALLSFTAR